MQLVIVDGGQLNDSIAARMQRENGTGSWMVYKDCDEEYAKQVTSEHKVSTRAGNGKKVLKWEPKYSHADNHYLDCEVYALAAAEIRGVRNLHLEAEPERQQPKKPEKSAEESWIERNENWI